MYTLVVLAANKTLRHDCDATAGHSLGPGAGLASSSLLSNIHNIQDGLNTVLLTVSILGFTSLFFIHVLFISESAVWSGSIFEGGVLLKLIVIYQTLNYS